MSHHAYFFAGDTEKGTAGARAFGLAELSLAGDNNPDLLVLSYGLFSVDDARAVFEMASRAPVQGSTKMLVICAPRIFHEAQNALLKLLEEPPRGVTIVLVIPSEGILLPTLRSRLLPLPNTEAISTLSTNVTEFISADVKTREKLISKLLDRAKSDKEEEKQAARADAITLVSGLLEASYMARTKTANATELRELNLFMRDLETFVPILHDRSAPLKLIFEHILLVIPKSLFVS